MNSMPSYGEDEGQAKKVRSNSLLLSFQPNRLLLGNDNLQICASVTAVVADTYSWVDS